MGGAAEKPSSNTKQTAIRIVSRIPHYNAGRLRSCGSQSIEATMQALKLEQGTRQVWDISAAPTNEFGIEGLQSAAALLSISLASLPGEPGTGVAFATSEASQYWGWLPKPGSADVDALCIACWMMVREFLPTRRYPGGLYCTTYQPTGPPSRQF